MVTDNGIGNVINFTSRTDRSKVKIVINGNNNTLNIGVNKITESISINVIGDNSTIDLDNLRRVGKLRILSKNSLSLKIGEMSSIEDLYILNDSAEVHLGKDCMISFKTTIRTTDAHGIYDLVSGDLLNPPSSIYIEDHVWLAQGVVVSKGSYLSKNCIVGAGTYIQKNTYPSNCIVAGSPARVVKEGVIWDRRMTNNIHAPDANVDHNFNSFID